MWPHREEDISFDQNLRSDRTNSVTFSHKFVSESSENEVEFLSALCQQRERQHPRDALKKQNRILVDCLIWACYT